jgi:hypothetical protein
LNWHEKQAQKAKRKTERAGRASRMVREARKAAKLEAERQARMDALAAPAPLLLPPQPSILSPAPPVGASQLAGVDFGLDALKGPAGDKNLHFDHPNDAIAAAIATVGPTYRVRKVRVDGAIQLVIDNPKTGTRVVVCGRR